MKERILDNRFFKDEKLNIIPIIENEKKPAVKWAKYQQEQYPREKLKNWKGNFAVICGKVSNNLVIMDLDNAEEYTENIRNINTLTVKTRRGYHLYFFSKKDCRKIPNWRGKKIDILGNKCYALIPPSKVNGVGYEIIKDVPILEVDDVPKFLMDYVVKDEWEKDNNEKWELLKNPDLFSLIINELGKKIVGENETKICVFLVACGVFVENPAEYTSFNLMVNSPSGSGKDYLIKNVLSIFPKPLYEKKSRITEKVLTYWHNTIIDPEWTWDGKILYLEDITNSILNGEVVKVFSSSGTDATVLVKQWAKDFKVNGKPVLFLTIAAAHPDKENLRRYVNVDLDETVNQTQAITKFQCECAEKGLVSGSEYNPIFTEALNQLKRVKVKIPFGKILENVFIGKENIILRTVNQRFIDFIKASAALHQYQREKDNDGFILAEEQDYEIARVALLKTMSNPFSIPLTKEQKKILEIFKTKLTDLKEDTIDEGTRLRNYFSVAEIEKYTDLSDKWLRKKLDDLTELGFLKKDRDVRESNDRKVMVYKYEDFSIINIPTYQELLELHNSLNERKEVAENTKKEIEGGV